MEREEGMEERADGQRPMVKGGRDLVVSEVEVVIGGEVLEEVALLLHDAAELVNVDLAITTTVSLVDHVLVLFVIDVLPSSSATRARLWKEILLLLSSSNSLNTFSVSSRESFSPILPVIISGDSPNSSSHVCGAQVAMSFPGGELRRRGRRADGCGGG
jgi:hypothetical protein